MNLITHWHYYDVVCFKIDNNELILQTPNLSLSNPYFPHLRFHQNLGVPGFFYQNVGCATVEDYYQCQVEDQHPEDPFEGLTGSPLLEPILMDSD